ncbi:MAG: 2-amino-4-hydroxy-6-hydroxymethyldihydropteridine diphosphokinase [Legionellales bacterium]|nr:2-amino-4-hydroxy-6-hydroxymethyldihydropteridine diphosphokinase [Legionellales bacterium]
MNYENEEYISTKCILGLGSNLDNPLQQIKIAITRIAKEERIKIISKSKLYRSKPHGGVKQPDFINCAILIETQLSPYLLLDKINSFIKEQNKLKIQTEHDEKIE